MISQFTLLYRSSFRENDHSLWRAPDGRVVISDQSGETPETTDDGPLYVDTGRVVKVPLGVSGVLLPLLTPSGKKTSTPTSFATLRRLKDLCPIQIEQEMI